jgi:hypothetical protein
MKKILAASAAAASLLTATLAWAAPQDFDIHNKTGQAIITIQVGPSGEDEWGEDILGVDVLADGESGEVTFDRGEEACLFDIRVTYQDGDEGDWRQINLCETTDIILQ